jgi:hypothetical protein
MSNTSSDEQALRNELAALYALHDTAVTDRDRYREALEPFARYAHEVLCAVVKRDEAVTDDRVLFTINDIRITYGDLRRAAEVLRKDDGR